LVTREIEGQFPNWKQVIPATNGDWTQVLLSEEAVKQLIQVIPNLPGADTANSTILLRVNRYLTIEGKNKDDEKWTSVPIQTVNVTGQPVAIALNREYLLKGLRFGLNKLEIQDSLTALIMSKGGKKMVIMPLRMEGGNVEVKQTNQETKPPAPETTTATEQPQPQPNPEATIEERIVMPKKNTPTEPVIEKADEKTTAPAPATKDSGTTITSPTVTTGIKSLVDQVDQIKDSLRSAIRDLSTIVDAVKDNEREKRTTEKEIEAIRAKLRQIQNVTI